MKKQYRATVVMSRLAFFLCSSICVLAVQAAPDETGNTESLTLAPPFSDHMVLQRERPVPVWGWAAPGAEVTVTFGGQRKTANADEDGKWMLSLAPMTASSTPRELSAAVGDGSGAVTVTNVVVGDIWICAGQSNMEMGLNLLNGFNPKVAPGWRSPEHMARAHQPGLRLFCAPKQFVTEPADRYGQHARPAHLGRWQPCTIENATHNGIWGGFSAVAFYFGVEIQPHADCIVGLVQVTSGGTAAEAWMSPEAIASLEHGLHCRPQEAVLEKNPEAREKPSGQDFNSASTCYNGLLHPLLPMAARGVLWFQGEANANGDWHYAEKLDGLIADWRRAFNHPGMPFYIVQLSSFRAYLGNPTYWPAVREAQLQVHRRIEHTGLVVTTDLYDWTDPGNIHPSRKQEVGRRLAQWALRDSYGHAHIEPSGPIYREMTIEDDKIRLAFDHAAGGLIAPGAHPDSSHLPGFMIAGEDRRFVPARAVAESETVVVWGLGLREPRYVRYGWDVFVPLSFYNQVGLPASPFRTDEWEPGVAHHE